MADYWKSQPRKFCEFCKVWIADNKPSIEFHEKGKKHKEYVQARISDVRKKSAQKREIQEKLDSDLAAIEAAAMKAYQKDIAKSKPVEYGPELAPAQASESSTVADNAQSTTTGTTDTTQDNWSAYQTPEGYTYYYNSVSGESTWECPASFQETTQKEAGLDRRKESETLAAYETETNRNDAMTSQPSKKDSSSSPYGAWTTVAVYDREAERKTDQVAGEEEKKPAAEKEKTRVTFKEKQTPRLSHHKTDFSENIAFKKRKVDQEKKKRNIRQRTDDS